MLADQSFRTTLAPFHVRRRIPYNGESYLELRWSLPMARKRVTSLRCPTCRKLVLRDDPEFPFCGERCRLIDLGKWASGGYVISTPINDPEAFESQLENERSNDSTARNSRRDRHDQRKHDDGE